MLLPHTPPPLLPYTPHPFSLLLFAGNTLCKSGSIAVFGNVVYSGLLNEHLWHLGVPLFTRLVRTTATWAFYSLQSAMCYVPMSDVPMFYVPYERRPL
uniref:Uncharacterized protein n=1 Tax=Knipowitschia caucasica TaxID=637954 RepID=A0AAV2KEZ8_KNICA